MNTQELEEILTRIDNSSNRNEIIGRIMAYIVNVLDNESRRVLDLVSQIENAKFLINDAQKSESYAIKKYEKSIRNNFSTTLNDLRKIGDTAVQFEQYFVEKNDTDIVKCINNILLSVENISDRFIEWNLADNQERLLYEKVVLAQNPFMKAKKKSVKKTQPKATDKQKMNDIQFDLKLTDDK